MRLTLSPAFVALATALCATFTDAQLNTQNLVSPASTTGSLTGLKYTSVGGTGTYNQVTNMIPGTFPSCTANPSCITSPKHISGNLAPFNEEMTFNFRGPLNLDNIAVYQPGSTNVTTWTQVSSWAAGKAPTNLVFMNNLGGDKSGEFTICGGNSQSFANGAWTDATTAANAEIAPGFLDENHEINIMTAQTCADSPCDGFARGTANHGWADSKMLVATFDMPPAQDASKVPAIWALNAQVVRAAEYGCNCRGVGSPGGCGELDILETLVGADPTQGISEIYSVKGATGSGSANFFARPTAAKATYGVIFDVETDSIAIQRLAAWDYTQQSIPRSVIDGYLGAPALEVSFATGATRRRELQKPRGVVGGHRRRHGI
ncbi:putative TOS1-like glycosyl hydrolase-domain-containing protein [Lenzites betulinus]|nr:putative TOS1-like glycosyl hydrolase-domain-containing protein [Lenzites betulinus]